MTENEVNIYSIAYRDCKEVAESIDVNEECGKANTILFYMDEILDALKIASELQAIGTIEEFKDLKEKSVAKKVNRKPNYDMTHEEITCPICGKYISEYTSRNYCDCGQKLDWSE